MSGAAVVRKAGTLPDGQWQRRQNIRHRRDRPETAEEIAARRTLVTQGRDLAAQAGLLATACAIIDRGSVPLMAEALRSVEHSMGVARAILDESARVDPPSQRDAEQEGEEWR